MIVINLTNDLCGWKNEEKLTTTSFTSITNFVSRESDVKIGVGNSGFYKIVHNIYIFVR